MLVEWNQKSIKNRILILKPVSTDTDNMLIILCIPVKESFRDVAVTSDTWTFFHFIVHDASRLCACHRTEFPSVLLQQLHYKETICLLLQRSEQLPWSFSVRSTQKLRSGFLLQGRCLTSFAKERGAVCHQQVGLQHF